MSGSGALGGRAWAKPALVSLSWIWLLSGALSLALLVLVMPAVPVPPELALVVRMLVLGVALVLGVLFPGALLGLLRGVPAPTAEAGRPQPVVVLAVALAATGVLALPTLVRPVVPILHVVVTGLPAALVTIAGAVLCLWLARAVWRCERRGLVGTAIVFAATGVSLAVTAWTVDPATIWTAMGARPEDADLLGEAPVGPSTIVVGVALVTIASLVWLRSVARHFDRG